MGKYLYHVPYVGYLANAIPNDSKPVVIQALGVGILGWAFILFLISIIGSGRKKRKEHNRMTKSVDDSKSDSMSSPDSELAES